MIAIETGWHHLGQKQFCPGMHALRPKAHARSRYPLLLCGYLGNLSSPHPPTTLFNTVENGRAHPLQDGLQVVLCNEHIRSILRHLRLYVRCRRHSSSSEAQIYVWCFSDGALRGKENDLPSSESERLRTNSRVVGIHFIHTLLVRKASAKRVSTATLLRCLPDLYKPRAACIFHQKLDNLGGSCFFLYWRKLGCEWTDSTSAI